MVDWRIFFRSCCFWCHQATCVDCKVELSLYDGQWMFTNMLTVRYRNTLVDSMNLIVVHHSVLIYRHTVLKSLEILLLLKAVKTLPKVQRTIEVKILEL